MIANFVKYPYLIICCSICKTDFFVTLMELFRTYCWNNLLHNQVRTCLVYALTPSAASSESPMSALHTHVRFDQIVLLLLLIDRDYIYREFCINFALQIIAKCKIVTHLIDCWKHNNEQVK